MTSININGYALSFLIKQLVTGKRVKLLEEAKNDSGLNKVETYLSHMQKAGILEVGG